MLPDLWWDTIDFSCFAGLELVDGFDGFLKVHQVPLWLVAVECRELPSPGQCGLH